MDCGNYSHRWWFSYLWRLIDSSKGSFNRQPLCSRVSMIRFVGRLTDAFFIDFLVITHFSFAQLCASCQRFENPCRWMGYANNKRAFAVSRAHRIENIQPSKLQWAFIGQWYCEHEFVGCLFVCSFWIAANNNKPFVEIIESYKVITLIWS